MKRITDLQPFIDYPHVDLHTVPLNGKRIYRNEKGKKQGFVFPTDWQSKYAEERNTSVTPIGGLLTGRNSVVAIDCDDTVTWQMFRALDPENTAFMESLGKLDSKLNPIEAGTIFYLHDENSLPSFRSTNNARDLDYYCGTGLVFLSTEANETKSEWYTEDGELFNSDVEKIVFKTMPDVVRATLELLKQELPKDSEVVNRVTNKNGRLGNVFDKIDFSSEEYEPVVTKILTPKEYRNDKYMKQKHLHPNDIEGSGHVYMFKIASILASDSTVDKELAHEVMDYLNNLWDDPMTDKALASITVNMFNGKQVNPEGQPYWSYDEHWYNKGYVALDRRNNIIEVFHDDLKEVFYFNNLSTGKLSVATTRQKAIEKLKSLLWTFSQKEFVHNNIHTFTSPKEDYGHTEDEGRFNIFQKSEALEIIHTPKKYEEFYKEPTEFKAYIEHFIPDEEQRTYLLRLIKTKLTTFDYSPVVPYIIGVQGSGKDLLMTVLSNIIGSEYVETGIGGEQFLEKYNGWLMDKYFVQLNELSNTVQTQGQKSSAQGILKTYTGSEQFQVRQMGKDHFNYSQTAMFIMTANSSPLAIEDTDRRLYYIKTPNTFDHSPQCVASSPPDIYRAIMAQTNDIAYWIATEFESLNGVDYVRAPDSAGREGIIFETLNTSSKIAWALANSEFELLYDDMLIPTQIFKGSDEVSLTDIALAYQTYSGKEADEAERTMSSAMKSYNMKPIRAGANVKDMIYKIEGLSNYSVVNVEDMEEE